LEAAVPQQRKLVIVTKNGERLESTVVTLSNAACAELTKTVDDGKPHKGNIESVGLEPPKG
jgi:hypothetical protein